MNFLSVVFIAAKRLWNNKGLTICAIVGLMTAVALISSIPLYTDAANFKVLQEELSEEPGQLLSPGLSTNVRLLAVKRRAFSCKSEFL